MKTMPIVIALAYIWLAAVHAQVPLTGKWQEVTPSGLDIKLDLTATQTSVTGTFTVKGRRLPITDGTVSKNTFHFKATLEDQPEGFTGKLIGDEITLQRDRNAGADSVILKRAERGLTGTWRGKTPNGFDLVLEVTAEESALTGTLTRDGQRTTISAGTVSKNAFTFKATINDQTEGFTGEFAGEEMKVWLDRQGPENAAILKRSKN